MKLRNSLEEAHIIVKEEKNNNTPKYVYTLLCVCFLLLLLLLLSIFFKSFIIHRTVDLTKKWTDNTKKSETSSSPLPDTYLY